MRKPDLAAEESDWQVMLIKFPPKEEKHNKETACLQYNKWLMTTSRCRVDSQCCDMCGLTELTVEMLQISVGIWVFEEGSRWSRAKAALRMAALAVWRSLMMLCVHCKLIPHPHSAQSTVTLLHLQVMSVRCPFPQHPPPRIQLLHSSLHCFLSLQWCAATA